MELVIYHLYLVTHVNAIIQQSPKLAPIWCQYQNWFVRRHSGDTMKIQFKLSNFNLWYYQFNTNPINTTQIWFHSMTKRVIDWSIMRKGNKYRCLSNFGITLPWPPRQFLSQLSFSSLTVKPSQISLFHGLWSPFSHFRYENLHPSALPISLSYSISSLWLTLISRLLRLYRRPPPPSRSRIL